MLKKQSAHEIANLLQVLMYAIENEDLEKAKQYVRKITDCIQAHTDPRSKYGNHKKNNSGPCSL